MEKGGSDVDRRCGSCARFVRVMETIDQNGEVKRSGECLLGVWSPPLYEHNTCSQYVRRGTFAAAVKKQAPRARGEASRPRGSPSAAYAPSPLRDLVIPEELLDMDADEFREVLRAVIREELGVGRAELGARWSGGEMVLVPGKEGTQEKRIPIESLFHKVVMIRDKLRVLEQKVNAHANLGADEKVQLQQYITQCYGSLTTFNVLFADRDDAFIGQKGKDD